MVSDKYVFTSANRYEKDSIDNTELICSLFSRFQIWFHLGILQLRNTIYCDL
jgi:hypothetical protein